MTTIRSWIAVRGANVIKGYWEPPDETNRVLRPGTVPRKKVLYTGDHFMMDGEAFPYFVSGKDDIIRSRGEKVSAPGVENILSDLPCVAQAVVIEVPGPIPGEAIIAPKEGADLDEDDVLACCKSRLEDFMLPKVVELKAALRKTPSEKISK